MLKPFSLKGTLKEKLSRQQNTVQYIILPSMDVYLRTTKNDFL
jgi:hypothetical protein